MKYKTKKGNKLNSFKIYDLFVLLFTGIFGLICFYPLWYVFIGSLNPSSTSATQGLAILPLNGISFKSYVVIIQGTMFRRSLMISVTKTLIGSTLSIIVTAMMAYGVSKKSVKGMSVMNFMVIFTMYFGGGLIPTFLLYLNLKIYNTFLVYVIPGVLSVWNFILFRNYFVTSIEKSLEESAILEGATDITVFFKIIIPLSMPIIAALYLFSAVSQWNDYTSYLYFVRNPRLMPFVMLLREILTNPAEYVQREGNFDASLSKMATVATNMKMTTIMVAMLPIMALYPFLQKHFTKGIMIGAVKE